MDSYTTPDYKQQLDSIFDTLTEGIENGLTDKEIKAALSKEMTIKGCRFQGINKYIDQYVNKRKKDIRIIRENHKRQKVVEVIEIYLLLQ